MTDVPSHFIPIVRKLISLIGYAETIALLRERGGRPMYIAKDHRQAEVLSHILQKSSVVALCTSELGGEFVLLPMPHKLLIIERDKEIREASKTHNKKQLAAIYQLTDRQIRNICNGRPADHTEPVEDKNPTLDLFDKVI